MGGEGLSRCTCKKEGVHSILAFFDMYLPLSAVDSIEQFYVLFVSFLFPLRAQTSVFSTGHRPYCPRFPSYPLLPYES